MIESPENNLPQGETDDTILTSSQHSLLQSLMEAFEAQTGMQMSFDDLTGAENGLHRDVPTMQLDWNHQTHSTPFCHLVKSDLHGDVDCVLNKVAANRIVLRSKCGFDGFCHVGLYDLVEPLILRGRVVGFFYFGSVVIKGKEAFTRSKIRRYCERRGRDPEPLLAKLKKVNVIDESSLPKHRQTLRAIAELAQHLCEAAGVRPEIYRNRQLRYPYMDPEQQPYVVKETINYITKHIDEPFIVKDIANHLRCHPDFLSRCFKRHTGNNLSLYLQQVRIERAMRLLGNPKMNIGTVADQAGFSDRVHFSKVFRRVTGTTPGQFQKRVLSAVEQANGAAGSKGAK